MERPELVRGVRLKGLDGFFKQFFYTDIKAQLIEALADWSILLPLALIAYLSVVFIAPLMAQTPTDESLTRIFLQANRKWCVPEPQELISYLLISTVVPLGMLIWLLTRTSIIARLTSSIKESILINILWVTAAISQLALLSFILLNVVDKQAVVVRYFLVG